MAGRAREHDLVAEERLEGHPPMAAGRADDPERELAARHVVDDRLRVGDRERDADARIRSLELAEQQRHHRAARARGGADLERAGELALARVGDLLDQLLLQREHALGAAVEPLAGLGRLDPAAAAVEQTTAEPLLERADLQAHGRLRHAELLGGEREALLLDDRAEGCELARIHKRSLCRSDAAISSTRYSGPFQTKGEK